MDSSGSTTQALLNLRRRLTVAREWMTARRSYAVLLRWTSPNLLQSTREVPSLTAMWNVDLNVDVVAYFPDDPLRVYQFEQWLPVLRRLHQEHRVLVVVRNLATFRVLQDSNADLPLIYARRIRDLNHVLQHADAKVFLYVNNSGQNFQCLSWPRALHVHLNHGESDKISMASNQAKAYDRVFVAGDAAVERYLDNLIEFDRAKLVPVGRPQLDLIEPRPLPKTALTTVMYAPTWEGETDAMNYTSVNVFGDRLVRRLCQGDGFRVVYKPHPRVPDGTAPIRAAHERIVRAIEASNAGRSAADRHVVAIRPSILDLMASCDVLISDVSSVALDWLYLHTDRPLWLTDPRGDVDRLLNASPAAAGSYLLDDAGVPGAAADITASITTDARREKREELRRYYFGDIATGQSTKRFLEEIDALAKLRDALVGTHDTTAHRYELEAGAT